MILLSRLQHLTRSVIIQSSYSSGDSLKQALVVFIRTARLKFQLLWPRLLLFKFISSLAFRNLYRWKISRRRILPFIWKHNSREISAFSFSDNRQTLRLQKANWKSRIKKYKICKWKKLSALPGGKLHFRKQGVLFIVFKTAKTAMKTTTENSNERRRKCTLLWLSSSAKALMNFDGSESEPNNRWNEISICSAFIDN